MTMQADRDTTAHRYFKPAEIARIIQAMDRGFAIVIGETPGPSWDRLPQPARLVWVSVIEELRRGAPARQVYEARSGEPWSELERDEQIRLEMQQLLVSGLSSVQR